MTRDGSAKTLTYSALGAAVFHGLLFFLFLNYVLSGPESRRVVINNVDLLMQEQEREIKKLERPKTVDFLKLALPSIPKIAAPELPKMPTIDIKAPERKAMDLPQKLAERAGRVTAAEKLEMDAARKIGPSIKDAGLDIKAERSAAAMAPRIELEEVGVKRAPTLPQDLRFDSGGPAVRPSSVQELNLAIDRARKYGGSAPQALADAGGRVERSAGRIAAVAMPERLAEEKAAEVQPSGRERPVISAATLAGGLKRQDGAMQDAAPAPAKKVEIEGPLSKRRVVKYYVPPFPEWARARGILEASVAIKFYVDASGRVLDNAAVQSTSGYGQIDRAALEAIKRWQFEPSSGPVSRQWGVITFRFVLD